ncbi:TPA: pentapeptide repeat-containing protein, partial [Escherichia coli]
MSDISVANYINASPTTSQTIAQKATDTTDSSVPGIQERFFYDLEYLLNNGRLPVREDATGDCLPDELQELKAFLKKQPRKADETYFLERNKAEGYRFIWQGDSKLIVTREVFHTPPAAIRSGWDGAGEWTVQTITENVPKALILGALSTNSEYELSRLFSEVFSPDKMGDAIDIWKNEINSRFPNPLNQSHVMIDSSMEDIKRVLTAFGVLMDKQSEPGKCAIRLTVENCDPAKGRIVSVKCLIGNELERRIICRIPEDETIDLSGANLTGADLTGADLTGADLTGADLTGADLTGAVLISAVLERVNLKYADLTDAFLKGAYLKGANLKYADLKGADLRGVFLIDANLKYTDLRGADLKYTDLKDVDLTDVDLTDVDLTDVDLTDVDL